MSQCDFSILRIKSDIRVFDCAFPCNVIFCFSRLTVLIHTIIARKIEQQQLINQYLQKEIVSLNKKVQEIQDLKKKKRDMLHRLDIIYQLQASRPLTVPSSGS